MRVLILLVVFVAGCGGITPTDTRVTAFFFQEDFGENTISGDVSFEGGSCWRMTDDIEVTLAGQPPDDRSEGGGNVILGCNRPFVFFGGVEFDEPMVLRLARGDLEEVMEFDLDFQVTRCDFAECVINDDGPGRPVAPPPPPPPPPD